MADKPSLEKCYEMLLKRFFAKEEEEALFEVSELGKELVMSRHGPDVLLDLHNICLKRLIQDVDPMTVGRMIVNSNEVLLNGIMAFAMNYYSFMDILEAHKRELEQANMKLKELDRLKSMFIASMSHELRTPLNSVIGFSSILLNEWVGPLNEEQKENLTIILKAGKHLLALINDVIDISKIEAGKVEPFIEDFDLHDVINEAVASFEKEIREKGLDLKVESIHQKMHTDRKRLLQSVLNLLSNAIKFTEKGSIAVQARILDSGIREEELKRENLQLSFSNQQIVEISIEDTGIGIKEEDLPKLFQPFVRLESRLKSKVLGTGLGLYLTKKLVREVLKGEISVSSRYGEGSSFKMKIPINVEFGLGRGK